MTAANNWSFVPAKGDAELLSGDRRYRSQRLVLALYERHPVLRAIVDRIASGPASLNWHLLAPTSKGAAREMQLMQSMARRERMAETKRITAEGGAKRVTAHPFLEWLGHPNPQMTGFDLIALCTLYKDLVGEDFVWLQETDAGLVAWPLPPPWVIDIPRDYSPVFRLTNVSADMPRDVAPENMLYRRSWRPSDPYERGIGMGQTLLDELAASESAIQFLAETLDTRAREDLLFIHPSFTPTQAAQIETSWLKKIKTALRRAAPMTSQLPEGTRVEKLGRTLRETQLVQVRESLRDAAMQAFSLPPEMMGVLENANRSTIDAADVLFETYQTVPRAESLRMHWQRGLVPRWDERLHLAYDSPVPESVEQMLAAMDKAPWSVRINEVRRRLKLDSLGDAGDFVAVPSGYTLIRVEDIGKVPAPTPKQALRDVFALQLEDARLAGTLDEFLQQLATRFAPASAPDKIQRQADNDAVGGAMVRLLEDLGDGVEGQIRATVDDALVKLIGDLNVTTVEDALLAGNLDEILDWIRYRDALGVGTGSLTAIHSKLARQISETVATELAAVVSELPYADLYAAAEDWAARHSAELVTAITEETREALRQLVSTAYDLRIGAPELSKALRPAIGLNRPQAARLDTIAKELAEAVAKGEIEAVQAARQLEKKSGEMLRYRSDMIAKTELWETGNAVQVETWKATPGLSAKYVTRWDKSPKNPCKICNSLHGQRQPIGGTFEVTVDGKAYRFQHPTAHPWCYCSLVLARNS